jgi:cytochrome oxidase Cu insertion factor (SCO1/SenC/PrrC family)
MPGMNSGINLNDPAVVQAFKTLLLHQGIIALLVFGSLGMAWVSARAWLGMPADAAPAAQPAEPAGRKVLRIGFGVLWLVDGILQAQPSMAIGLPSKVIEPTAASSPAWVQNVVNWAGTTWSFHPMQAGAAAVWIQVGIGIWMLTAVRGLPSRLSGLAGVGWGLVVWVFGESFGGIFAPGLTWLFGAPGAAALYVVAGALIVVPERAWRTERVGRLTLASLGVFLAGMAVLQAWPGRGFWQGTLHGEQGTLAGMTSDMATTPQPHFLSGWVAAFTAFDQAHGFAVNLLTVIALAITGLVFLTGLPTLIRPALIGFAVLCVADWLLIEDIGIFGGLGTDPNSMIPFALLGTAGCLGLTPVPVWQTAEAPAAGEPAVAAETEEEERPAVPATRQRAAPRLLLPRLTSMRLGSIRPETLRQAVATASLRSVVSAGALGVIILGAAPMLAAQANPVADPILAQAINGASAPVDYPAPHFSLTDQNGRSVTLASLRGKVVLLTFLDDTCTTDCPLIAQEFRLAGQLLGPDAGQVELVAINYNPLYTDLSYVRAFNRQEGLARVPNWRFLTGTRGQLEQVWQRFGVPPAEVLPAGSMIGHGDYAFVIDQNGRVRNELGFDTGPATQATKSSFAAELSDAARQLLEHP